MGRAVQNRAGGRREPSRATFRRPKRRPWQESITPATARSKRAVGIRPSLWATISPARQSCSARPTDNPLIATLAKRKVLPYAVTADVPGRGRGLLAWQLDIIRPGEESIAVIATDAAGLSEGVGSLYAIAAAMEPLTRWDLPVRNSVVGATSPTNHAPELSPEWQIILPDRAAWLKPQADGSLVAYSLDGSLTTIGETGQIRGQRAATKEEAAAPKPPYGDEKSIANKAITKDKLLPHRIVKWLAADKGLTAVAYWGGTLQILDAHGATKDRQLLSQDIAAMTWSGGKLVVALADGRVLGFDVR